MRLNMFSLWSFIPFDLDPFWEDFDHPAVEGFDSSRGCDYRGHYLAAGDSAHLDGFPSLEDCDLLSSRDCHRPGHHPAVEGFGRYDDHLFPCQAHCGQLGDFGHPGGHLSWEDCDYPSL